MLIGIYYYYHDNFCVECNGWVCVILFFFTHIPREKLRWGGWKVEREYSVHGYWYVVLWQRQTGFKIRCTKRQRLPSDVDQQIRLCKQTHRHINSLQLDVGTNKKKQRHPNKFACERVIWQCRWITFSFCFDLDEKKSDKQKKKIQISNDIILAFLRRSFLPRNCNAKQLTVFF